MSAAPGPEPPLSPPESPVSLPSDASSVVHLPSDAKPEAAAASADPHACCLSGCRRVLQESPALARRVLELQQALDQSSRDQARMLQFACLKQWGSGTGWRRYHAWNMALCQLTKHQMKKMNKQISEGLLQPERSLKETQRQKSSRPALQHADALLAWLHQNVAEDLAEGVRVDGEREAAKKKRIAADPLPKLASIPFLDRLEEEEQGVRWMPPGTTLAEMHDLSMSFLQPDTRVSYSTFIGCYHRLKIRNEGQHSKCSLCERFKAYRKQCSAPADSKKVSEEYASHLEAVMQDRAADQRLCAAAQLAAGVLDRSSQQRKFAAIHHNRRDGRSEISLPAQHRRL